MLRHARPLSYLLAAVTIAILWAPVAGFAQQNLDEIIELLRADIRTGKIGWMTEAMQRQRQQSEVFLPLYREYQNELMAIGDERIALAKDYAEKYASLTVEEAKDISKRWFDQQERRFKLLKKYHDKVAKAVDPVVAARFVQVENTLQMAIDLQVASGTPLMP